MTQDVDLLIALDVRPQALLARLSAAGFRSKGRSPVIRLEDAEFIQLFCEPPGELMEIQLDLLLANTEFQKKALERRVWLPAGELGFEVAVLACEDLIIMKLGAGRIIDRFDAAALLKANRYILDLQYLTSWVAKLGVDQAFNDAWKDAFGVEKPPR